MEDMIVERQIISSFTTKKEKVMKKVVFFAFFAVMLFAVCASAQIRPASYQSQMSVGVIGADGGDRIDTEILVVNRTNESNKFVNTNFFKALDFLRSDGVRAYGNSSFFFLSANKNNLYRLSSQNIMETGDLTVETMETLASRHGDYLSNVTTQVVTRRVDSSGNVVFASATPVGGGTTSYGRNCLMQALWTSKSTTALGLDSITGIQVQNENEATTNARIDLYDLFDFTHTGPYRTVTIEIPMGSSSIWLDQMFPNLPINDGGGSQVTDGNLELHFDAPVGVVGLRRDNGFEYGIPIFIGRDAYEPIDVVKISKAVQNGSKLKLKASSDDPSAYLTVTVTFADDTKRDLGPLKSKYKKINHLIIRVRVTSDYGGFSEIDL